MRKPVFEIAGTDFRATVVDEKTTFELIQKKLTEKKHPDPDPLLDGLEDWLRNAKVGAHHTVNDDRFTAVVTKTP